MPQSFGTAWELSQGSTFGEALRRSSWEIIIDTFDTPLEALTVSFPRYELEQVEVYHFNERVKIAAKPNVGDVKIEIIDFGTDSQTVQQLWTWFKQVYDPNTGIMGPANIYKKQGQLILYDPAGNVQRTWTLQGLWPRSSPTPEENLDYSSQEVQKISLTLSCDRASLDGPVASTSA